MTNVPKTLVLLSFLGLVACGGGPVTTNVKSGADASNRGGEHAAVGKPAPDLLIQSLNGKGTVDAAHQGKILVVDFWATWCGPCRSSFPQLEALSKRTGEKVTFVGVSVDDEKTDILKFAKETGATFPIGWDEGHAIAERWNVSNMPTTYIVDGSGKVRYIHAGYHDGEATLMEKELTGLVDEGGASSARLAKSDDTSSSVKETPAETKTEAATKDETTTEALPSPKKPRKKSTTAKPKSTKKPSKKPKTTKPAATTATA